MHKTVLILISFNSFDKVFPDGKKLIVGQTDMIKIIVNGKCEKTMKCDRRTHTRTHARTDRRKG